MILAGIVTLLILDLIWLTFNKSRYARMVQLVQNKTMRIKLMGGVMAYTLMVLALVYFIVPLAKQNKDTTANLVKVLKYGAFFGLIVYGIYNATNYAIFDNYDIPTAVLDTCWGTFVYFVATYVALL
jgi:uncharacterized membrane protein